MAQVFSVRNYSVGAKATEGFRIVPLQFHETKELKGFPTKMVEIPVVSFSNVPLEYRDFLAAAYMERERQILSAALRAELERNSECTEFSANISSAAVLSVRSGKLEPEQVSQFLREVPEEWKVVFTKLSARSPVISEKKLAGALEQLEYMNDEQQGLPAFSVFHGKIRKMLAEMSAD